LEEPLCIRFCPAVARSELQEYIGGPLESHPV
jgi:hypothetical protein